LVFEDKQGSLSGTASRALNLLQRFPTIIKQYRHNAELEAD
jgi:hypothetical protein